MQVKTHLQGEIEKKLITLLGGLPLLHSKVTHSNNYEIPVIQTQYPQIDI